MICGEVSYHDYAGILVDEDMRKKIEKDLGPKNKILVLRNHGAVFCGANLEEAVFWLLTFMAAADIQFHALASSNGLDNLVIPPKHVLEQVQRVIKTGVNEKPSDGIDWKFGEMEFEAEMRRMDFLVRIDILSLKLAF